MKHRSSRTRLISAPGGTLLLSGSVLARLPMAMLSVALLVNAQRQTGSFGVAGIVVGAYALSSSLSAPRLGRLVDARGQTGVLVAGAGATAAILCVTSLLPHDAPPALLVVLAAAAGLATPPLDACVRTLLPVIVSDQELLPTLYSFESAVLEVTFVAGPPVALTLGVLFSTGAAVAAAGLIMLAGTLVFVIQAPSRTWRPARSEARPRGGLLRLPPLRTLLLIVAACDLAFGATEVGVTAAAHSLGDTAGAGPLLGLWGLGSLIGGAISTRMGGNRHGLRGVLALLTALAVTHALLIFGAGSVIATGVLITVAGMTIAPTLSGLYALVDAFAPSGSHTEAFSWMVTASLSGAAAGSAIAGALVQLGGPVVAFGLVGIAGGLAVLVAVLGFRTLEPKRSEATADLAPSI